jgi:hypothetical protein
MYNPGRSVRVLYRKDWSEDFTKLKSRYGDTVEDNRVADPRFRGLDRGDFDLLADSPAIGAGELVEVPSLKLSGTTLNIGAVQSSVTSGWTVDR